MKDLILAWLSDPTHLLAILTALVGAASGLFGAAWLSIQRKKHIALAAYHAFHIVEDLAAETDSKAIDKAALGLQQVNRWMLANGWRTLKENEQELVALEFKAIHGAGKVAEARAAALPVPK